MRISPESPLEDLEGTSTEHISKTNKCKNTDKIASNLTNRIINTKDAKTVHTGKKLNDYILNNVPNKLKDKEIHSIAIAKNIYTPQFVPINTEDYNKIGLATVKENGYALQFVPATVRGYNEICLTAVKENGYALQFVPATVRGYNEICLAAVKRNSNALKFVPVNLRNREICLAYIVSITFARRYQLPLRDFSTKIVTYNSDIIAGNII